MATIGSRKSEIVSLLLLLFLFCACGDDRREPAASEDRTADSTPAPERTATPAATAPDEKIKIKTPDDKRVAEFKLRGDRVNVEIGEEGSTRVLRGEMRDNGKRKYEIDGGRVVMEVKADDDAFKVRTPDGKLLWKVKLAADKIKISDNEENQHPYVLKIREEKIDVEDDEKPLGEVKLYADRGKVKVKDAGERELFESNTSRRSAMYGVLLMERIPEAERYVIMAELLARGR